MKVVKASNKQVKYACKFFHYAKRVPQRAHSYSVYNDNNEWCGVIVFGFGANPRIARPFNLWQGQVLELVRVALNGKQETTSKALAMALKKLKKDNPQIKIVVSYADIEQKHSGIIYQATNWLYLGIYAEKMKQIEINGKLKHKKSVFSTYGTASIEKLKKITNGTVKEVGGFGKHKYIYCFDKKERKKYEKIKKEYPKKES